MPFATQKSGDALIILMQGRLDAMNAPEFDQQAGALLEQGEMRLVVDFSALDYISSAGLRSMLMLAKKVQPAGGRMVLCGLGGMVAKVFEVSGFADIFTISADREAACQALD